MPGSATRIVLPAAAVLALLGVVAIAATGTTPAGSGGTRVSGVNSLLDVVASVSVVAFVLAFAFLVYVLTHRDEMPKEYAARKARGFGLLYAFLFVLLTAALARHYNVSTQAPPIEPTRPRARPAPVGGKEHVYQAHVLWLPVLVVLILVALGVTAVVVARRRQKRALAGEGEGVAETVANVLEDTLDDLRRETDPRRAVIAAYARLERVLAAYGLPRRLPETPEEYLVRVLTSLEVEPSSVRRLTDLFTRAKFSQHEVDTIMKEEAIAALVRVRDELRAASKLAATASQETTFHHAWR